MKQPTTHKLNRKHFFRSRSHWIHQTHAIGRDPQGMPIAYRVAGSYRQATVR